MQAGSTDVRVFTVDDYAPFMALVDALGFSDVEYYERCLERHKNGDLEIILVLDNAALVGFCLLNYAPKYAFFKVHEMPEIQDLNVLPNCRRRGFGGALVRFCEQRCADKGFEEVGIGVGLDHSFGAAQRLYARLGYIPDGNGVTYDRQQVAIGTFKPIDAQLSLMMSKRLKK